MSNRSRNNGAKLTAVIVFGVAVMVYSMTIFLNG